MFAHSLLLSFDFSMNRRHQSVFFENKKGSRTLGVRFSKWNFVVIKSKTCIKKHLSQRSLIRKMFSLERCYCTLMDWPCVADTLDVEESFVRFRLGLLQRPQNCSVVQRLVDGPVDDDWHPHVRMGFQTEGHDGHADEEDRNHGHHLWKKETLRECTSFSQATTEPKFHCGVGMHCGMSKPKKTGAGKSWGRRTCPTMHRILQDRSESQRSRQAWLSLVSKTPKVFRAGTFLRMSFTRPYKN